MSAAASAHDAAGERAQLAVLGGGPGGYTAAFRAADLGLDTVLIDSGPTLGGVCLNRGCIPSKALLHVARVLSEAQEAAGLGVRFQPPEVDLDGVRAFKDGVVGRLTNGLAGLARQRGVRVVRATGSLLAGGGLALAHADGSATTLSFEHCIVAVGSRPATLAALPDDERVMDSTAALELGEVPGRLLIVGAGIIGLELATVYDALGSRVTVVELQDSMIAGADRDLLRPLQRRVAERYEAIHLSTRVAAARAAKDGIHVELQDAAGERRSERFDRVLVAVGRRANGDSIGAREAGVELDERGFIAVDAQMRTSVPSVFAIGDVVGEPMLAHKAMHEAKVAAEAIAGRPVAFDARAIPSVAYTDPEIAWMGLTENAARATGVEYEKAVFPWSASGRALSVAREEGMTKLLLDPKSKRVLGAGIVGVNAGELIAEAVHALEMGADAGDLGLTIHAHPTLSETLGLAGELAAGTITDLPLPRAAAAVR